MKDMITVTKKSGKNLRLLAEKVKKIAMTKVTKMITVINIGSKYSYIISNIDIYIA